MTTIIQTDEEIKNYHLKRLEQLALSHIGDIPWLDEPNYEQKQWIKRKLQRPNTWPNAYKIGNVEL